NPVVVTDILANRKDSRYRQEKVNKFTIYRKSNDSFCVAQQYLVLFGTPTTVRETLLREGPPDLSTGLQTAIRAADFSKAVVFAANAKDIARKFPLAGQGVFKSQELADAAIRADAAVVHEVTFSKAIEWRSKVCCKDATTAKELK